MKKALLTRGGAFYGQRWKELEDLLLPEMQRYGETQGGGPEVEEGCEPRLRWHGLRAVSRNTWAEE